MYTETMKATKHMPGQPWYISMLGTLMLRDIQDLAGFLSCMEREEWRAEAQD